MQKDTAILLFRRVEASEQSIKSFSNKAIVSYFNLRTKRLLAKTNLPVIEYLDKDNPAISVQERFYQAVKNVFDKGFQNVIVVGNDCPQLTTSEVQEASNLLNSNQLVIGPDQRGGAYLLGISRSIFNRKWALALPWHSDQFASQAANSIQSVAYLTTLCDVNAHDELASLSKETFRKHLVRQLIAFINNLVSELSFPKLTKSLLCTSPKSLRAPPALIQF